MTDQIPPKTAAGSSKKGFVLIAEDEADYADIYRFKLSQEGYEVIVVANGEQVLKIAREKKPDLVLLDLMMPIKDGYETLAEMKQDKNLKDVQVVVLSNLGVGSEIERVRKLGAMDFLVKSDISFQEVLDKVAKYTEKSRAAGA